MFSAILNIYDYIYIYIYSVNNFGHLHVEEQLFCLSRQWDPYMEAAPSFVPIHYALIEKMFVPVAFTNFFCRSLVFAIRNCRQPSTGMDQQYLNL